MGVPALLLQINGTFFFFVWYSVAVDPYRCQSHRSGRSHFFFVPMPSVLGTYYLTLGYCVDAFFVLFQDVKQNY